MTVSRQFLWAGGALAICALSYAPTSKAADPAANRVYVAPGENPLMALYAGKAQQAAKATRAAWLAAGHSPKSTSVAAPAITGGSIAGSTLTVADPTSFPKITFSFQTDTPGLETVYFIFTSPNGQSAYYANYGDPTYDEAGTRTFENFSPPAYWSQPGTWTLAQIEITDRAGNMTVYDATQIAALFSSTTYTVKNTGLIDPYAPTISSGKLINKSVSLSATYPELRATITAAESGSGLLEAYIIIEPPGGAYAFYENVPLPRPQTSGALNASTVFAQYDQTGTWSIVGFAVCDYAQNCTGSRQQSDVVALFGTDTFNVTP